MKLLMALLCLVSLAAAHADHPKTYKAEHKHTHGKGLKKKKLVGVKHKSYTEAEVTVPGTYDLRPQLTAIRDQGSCGSCWMHSVTAVHRDGHAILSKDQGYQALSEQDMDCVTTEAGCNGGYFDAFDFIMKGGKGLQGQHSEIQLPYKAQDGKCRSDLPIAAQIKGWHMLGNGTSVTTKDIMSYVAQTGLPVSITVAAGAGDWEMYSGGIYNGCKMAGTDHMINIVGWDCEKAKDADGHCKFDSSGKLPAGVGTWILRNSWGTGWGEGGWMRSKITDKSGKKCNNVAEEAAVAEFSDEPLPPVPPPVPIPPCRGLLCPALPWLPWCDC